MKCKRVIVFLPNHHFSSFSLTFFLLKNIRVFINNETREIQLRRTSERQRNYLKHWKQATNVVSITSTYFIHRDTSQQWFYLFSSYPQTSWTQQIQDFTYIRTLRATRMQVQATQRQQQLHGISICRCVQCRMYDQLGMFFRSLFRPSPGRLVLHQEN